LKSSNLMNKCEVDEILKILYELLKFFIYILKTDPSINGEKIRKNDGFC
jgi:hypothetical protein